MIIIYHRVLDQPDPLRPFDPDRACFDRQIRHVSRWWRILPLRDAISRLHEGTLPARAVSITFDDGYEDNLTNAVPVLQQYAATATFFVASGYSGKCMMFNDLVVEAVRNCKDKVVSIPGFEGAITIGETTEQRLAAISSILEGIKYRPVAERHRLALSLAADHDVDLSNRMMMTREQVRQMRESGMEVGAHTENHPILRNLSDPDAKLEIQNGKSALQDLLQEEVRGFAYPNGKSGRDFSQRDVDLVRDAGFEYAVTTDWAAADSSCDIFKLPRQSLSSANARNFATILKAKLRP